MNDTLHPALLPAGLCDVLPPDAEAEARIVERLMAGLAAHGYERVEPPLIEYEDSLLGGAGAAMAPETFRMMDPMSQRMIGVRADMTLQVARIATTRLVRAPRPLRLCYAGPVLRVRGSQLQPERQLGQIGAELIGTDAPEADAEIVALAAESLASLGIADLTVDLSIPTLVPTILDRLAVPEALAAAARGALDRKDAAAVHALGGAVAQILARLMDAAGPARASLAALKEMTMPGDVAPALARLEAVLGLIEARAPGLSVTIDPVENRGFEYHTGIGFTLFCRDSKDELGRGGRYHAGIPGEGSSRLAAPSYEPATGFSLYAEALFGVVPAQPGRRRVFVPAGTDRDAGRRLRAEGYATVAGLDPVADIMNEARRLGCAFLWRDGETIAIPPAP